MKAPRPKRKPPRLPADQYQLALPLSWLSESDLIDALRQRGVSGIRRVRYRPNRSRLISLSADRNSLNLHECFRGATDIVIDAIAIFLRDSTRPTEARAAVRIMRDWSEGQVPVDVFERKRRGRALSAGTPAQRAFIAAMYRHLNRASFGDRLPEEVTIRLSNRMVRRFGHVEYRRPRNGVRTIVELGLNIDLLLEQNERHLLDTMLHEMAHIEAWVVHGHRGHGEPWQRIARRVGCEVNAASRVRMRRRRFGADADRVPDLDSLITAARERRVFVRER
jgi:hypothetical protein